MEIEIEKRIREFYAARVLDVCFGARRHVFPLAKKGLDVVGLDFDPEMIKEAKQKERL
jgi:2-polyprenyl-3-methyl-5-hydroxy-6-metoxy-1,4-benzoquinol methylase